MLDSDSELDTSDNIDVKLTSDFWVEEERSDRGVFDTETESVAALNFNSVEAVIVELGLIR